MADEETDPMDVREPHDGEHEFVEAPTGTFWCRCGEQGFLITEEGKQRWQSITERLGR